MRTKKGFTLIELLVVIAIIGLLSSVIFAGLNSARTKSRDARRLADLKEMQKALAFYADEHGGKYPLNTTGVGAEAGAYYSWLGTTPGCYNFTTGTNAPMAGYINSAGSYIADPISPKYIPTIPQDPKRVGNSCYIYISDGTFFKFLVYQTVESFNPRAVGHPLADSIRDNSFSIWYGQDF